MSNALNSLNINKVNGYNPFRTLMVREFWEHKTAIFYTPLFISSFFIVMILIGLGFSDGIHLGDLQMSSDSLAELSQLHSQKISNVINGVLLMSTALIWIGVAFAMIFTALGSLYDERKEGSILFWKSMPVSDTQTVFSKIITVLFVIPLVAIPFAFLVQVFTLSVFSFFASSADLSIVEYIWGPAQLLNVTVFFLTKILTAAIWISPIFAWFFLVSVVTKKSPFLTAFIIPAIIIAAEGIILKSSHLIHWIVSRFINEELLHSFERMEKTNAFDFSDLSGSMLVSITSVECLTGVVIAAAMIYGTIQIRKHKSI